MKLIFFSVMKISLVLAGWMGGLVGGWMDGWRGGGGMGGCKSRFKDCLQQ